MIHNVVFRYIIHLAYDGTAYSGWQRQKSTDATIQQLVEDALSNIIKQKIIIHGCGRTDKGVHAANYIGHFDCSTQLNDIQNLLFILTNQLPDDISVYNIIETQYNFNAQLDATGRVYHYYCHTEHNAFKSRYSTYTPTINDLDIMASGIKILENITNYSAMCKTPDKHNHTFCTVKEAHVYYDESENQICIKVKANRFLRSMMRIIAYDIIKVGCGELSLSDFEAQLLKSQDKIHFNMAPSNGLFLYEVLYDDFHIELKPSMNDILLNESSDV